MTLRGEVSPNSSIDTELMRTATLTQVNFFEAATAWLETRRPYISPKTFHEYELNIKTLTATFGAFRLTEISADQIRAYQRIRMGQCGPFAINHECSVLQQMLKRIGRWPEIAPDYQPLPLPKEKRGKVLRDEQKAILLRIASENPDWAAAYYFAMIAVNTTAGPKETMTLRLKDVDLHERVLTIQPEGAKNIHRIRTIPMNEEALHAAKMAIERARKLGAVEPEHYLFPFRVNKGSHYDPSRHQTTFKTAWLKLRAKAGLQGFRMYDLRHHAITSLLENPQVSEETAEAIAGHISREMKKRYSHVRMEVKRHAIDALIKKSEKPKRQKPAKSTKSTGNTAVADQLVGLLSKLLKTG